ncbi:MAG: electron transport complex subunit E [Lachnospiraceae bacterium]|nr:electron transport complex subunit E [Lachnospiraceae bacterium]MBR5731904.1 electron transport complex subunit E [Lachnospiraceae bacterium]
MNKCTERLYNGLIKENPTLVLMLGMCPTLAVTTSAFNGLGMGLSTTAVLIMSNMMISALRKIIPDKVRMPSFIVIVASFVTIVDLLIQGYLPSLNKSLGIYIPLIVVNCIILGRAEAYASKNPVLPSIFDGIGMGLGFTGALTIIGLLREILGAGTAFGFKVMPEAYEPFSIFVMAPGAFFVLAILTAIQNKLKLKSATNGDAPVSDEPLACGGNCAECIGNVCTANRGLLEQIAEEEAAKKADAKASAKKAFPEVSAAPAAPEEQKEGGNK